MKTHNFFKILTISLIISVLLPSFAAFAYSDVTSSTDYYKEIKSLEDKNLLPEFPENKFNPDEKATPVDLYTMLMSYSQTKPTDQSEVNLPYTDVKNSEWYSPLLQKAIDLKVLNPLGLQPEFQPTRQVAKREAITTLFDTLGIGANKFFDKKAFPFGDLDSNGAFAAYAFKSYEIGIDPKGNFDISKRISKAELAHYLYMIDKSLNSSTKTQTVKTPKITITVNKSSTKTPDTPAFEVFLDVWDTVHEKYYYKDKIDDEKMMYGAIKGAIGTLDDHYTEFTEPKEPTSGDSLKKEYEGIGMSVELVDGVVTVVSPFKGSPAEKAGVKPNDIILKIDGNSTEGLGLNEAVNFIKGKAGSVVTLIIQRDTKIFDLKVTRGYIITKTVEVEYLQKNGGYIAHINLFTFGQDTLNEFIKTAQEISEKSNVKGIILDLRSNPGGYLDVAIDMNGVFFKTDKIATILENSSGKKTGYKSVYEGADKEYSSGMGLLSDYKTIVLINKGSASASEILAGSLQDYKKAKLIGEQSFGKGTVQELSHYDDDSIFKLTISKWLTPTGRDINKKGLTPDKVVMNVGGEDTQLNTALGEF